MAQSGNADANRRARRRSPARSTPARKKPATAAVKTPAAKTGSAKPAKGKAGNGAAPVRAKSKPTADVQPDKEPMKSKKDQKKQKKLLKRLERAAKGEKKDKDRVKTKKKSASSGRVTTEIDYESRMNREEAVAYFDALVAGLKQGSVRFKQGDENVVIRPSELVDVEIKARASGRKEKVRFEISWLSDYSGKMSISSD